MDLKAMAAMQLAEEYHCKLLPERCPDCDAPLVTFGDQGVAFCIVDTAKHEKAQGDRKLLDSLLLVQKLATPTVDTKIIVLGPRPQQTIHWNEYLKRKAI